MENMVLTLHIIVCVILILLVLLQSGKEGMGVIFGGGSSSLFGGSGAGGILVKLTTFIAIVFIITSLGYNILISGDAQESVFENPALDDPFSPSVPQERNTAPAPVEAPAETPAAPSAPPAAPAP